MSRRLATAVFASAALVTAVLADPPKVKTVGNHVSPLMVEVTFKDEKLKPREVMLIGIGKQGSSLYITHQFDLTGDGDTSVGVWLDTIAVIDEIDDRRLRVVGQDGAKRDYRHATNKLVVYRDDDSSETIPLNQVKAVRFLDPPRKDKQGNAMFNHWRYSPYTGERLPVPDR